VGDCAPRMLAWRLVEGGRAGGWVGGGHAPWCCPTQAAHLRPLGPRQPLQTHAHVGCAPLQVPGLALQRLVLALQAPVVGVEGCRRDRRTGGGGG
jgi:hypothetical protein